jgi:histidinol dehydrogenase
MRFRIIEWKTAGSEERSRLLNRSELNVDKVMDSVTAICDAVGERGDEAVREFSARFDGATDQSLPLQLAPSEIEEAVRTLDAEVRAALDYAIENVRKAHEHQRPEALVLTETRPGVLAGERTTPIPAVGLYVPRGKGSFPSMLYMLAVPASIAGVPRLCLCSPPDNTGKLDPAVVYSAASCGIHEIYRIGGAHAIAAMALGTQSVKRVDKIVGPGSTVIAAAKRVLRDRVDVGLPAGPSESMIIADETDDPYTIAIDMLIEAEHGSESQALLITTSRELADRVGEIVPGLVSDTPEPQRGFLESVFGSYGGAILVDDVANEFAPEHLQLRTADPWSLVGRIDSAAEILIGSNSAFSLANYVAGANAVLPTGGMARSWSGVSVMDFVKRSSVVQVTREGFEELSPRAALLADYEGFHWHARALRDRGGSP